MNYDSIDALPEKEMGANQKITFVPNDFNSIEQQVILPWHQTLYLQMVQQYQRKNLAQVCLFSAAPYSGKKHLALQLMHYLLCLNPQAHLPCSHCSACLLVQAQTHPNIICLAPDASSRYIKISDIRDMIELQQHTNLYPGVRCILIDAIDDVLPAASHALLKTLEEPPRDTFFFLIHRQEKKILPTILSRCQMIHLAKPDQLTALNWLQNQIAYEAPFCQSALQFSEGLPLLALELLKLEQKTHSSSKKAKETNTGLIPLSWRNHFLKKLLSFSSDVLSLTEDALQYDYLSVLDSLCFMMRDMSLLLNDVNAQEKLRHDVPREVFEKNRHRISQEKINQFYESIIQLRQAAISALHLNEKLQLENVFIQWLSP